MVWLIDVIVGRVETGLGLDEMTGSLVIEGAGGVKCWGEGGQVSHVNGTAPGFHRFTQLAGREEWMWNTVLDFF